MQWLRGENPRKGNKWIQAEHHNNFGDWLKEKIQLDVVQGSDIDDTLRWIARGPTKMPLKHQSYVIDGRRFNTKARDAVRVNQNSGVSITAETMQISSAKDKNPHIGSLTFYGVIEEIWELDYCAFRTPVFKCAWIDDNSGVKRDDLGFTLVDLKKLGSKNEPFILASQAKQVFYIDDPLTSGWAIVLIFDPRDVTNDDDLLIEENVGLELGDRRRLAVFSASIGPCDRDDHPGTWVTKK